MTSVVEPSNPQVIGGFTYENVILRPEQFIVITSQSLPEYEAEKLIFNKPSHKKLVKSV